MLLTLYAARLEGRRLYQAALANAADVPPTTALRVTARMRDAGYFVREPDSRDRRRARLGLSPAAAARLRAYLATAAALVAPPIG
jgi:DNA-binding MarR family transcriptional regulator